MQTILTYDTLKTKQRALREGFPESTGLRVHRAISWIGRAENSGDDNDARFIFLWIAFNAAYANDEEFGIATSGDRQAFSAYFEKLDSFDNEQRIYHAIWTRFNGPVRLLLANRYVFSPFWRHHNGVDGYDDWEQRFTASAKAFAHAFQEGDCAKVLTFVFDRLYMLRNQLVHGGATWNSSVNRSQIRDGAEILAFLMPIFTDIMMDHPSEDWGKPFFPVIP